MASLISLETEFRIEIIRFITDRSVDLNFADFAKNIDRGCKAISLKWIRPEIVVSTYSISLYLCPINLSAPSHSFRILVSDEYDNEEFQEGVIRLAQKIKPDTMVNGRAIDTVLFVLNRGNLCHVEGKQYERDDDVEFVDYSKNRYACACNSNQQSLRTNERCSYCTVAEQQKNYGINPMK